MSDFDDPPVQIIPAAFGMAGATGPTGPPGGAGASFPSRTAMAAYNPGTLNNGDPFYLSESGREGMFIVDSSSNWTAQIAADTAQGLFVVSTAVAGKVYRRVIPSGRALSTWWGVSQSATPSANTAAFTAALAALKATGNPGANADPVNGQGNNAGSIGLHTPAGHYKINAEIPIKHGLDFTGDCGIGGDQTVIIQTSATAHGIHVYGTNAGIPNQAYGCRIRGLFLRGAFNGTNRGPYHGIFFEAACRIDDIEVEYWPGSGIRGHGDTADNNNANCFHISNIWGAICDWTVYVDGNNCQAGLGLNIKGEQNRFGTVFDDSFLGSTWLGGLCEGSGVTANYLTRCEKNGHIYTVKYGQEAFCAANAPSGTKAHNTGWLYWKEGTPDAGAPTWTAGQTWYFGAANACNPDDPGNTRAVFIGFYHEPGVNPVIMAVACTYIPAEFNGTPIWAFDGTPFAATWTYNNTSIFGNDTLVGRNLYVDRDLSLGYLAFDNADPDRPLFDSHINWENSNFYHVIQARYWNAHAASNVGSLTFARNYGILLNTQISGGQIAMQYNDTIITNTGVNFFSPGSDNAIYLGGAGTRWKEIYAANGTINTSDERDKQSIVKPSNAILDAWAEVDWYQYQFKDAVKEKGEDKARTHVGLVSQRIAKVFKKHRLDPFALGLLCHDEWEDQFHPIFEEVEVTEEVGKDEKHQPVMAKVKKHVPVMDKNGEPVTKRTVKAGERYGVRYTEALALEAALQRRRADQMEARLEALEAKLKGSK